MSYRLFEFVDEWWVEMDLALVDKLSEFLHEPIFRPWWFYPVLAVSAFGWGVFFKWLILQIGG